MDKIPILSESDVIETPIMGQNKIWYKELYKIDDILKCLRVEMGLRGFSKRTSQTYLYYNAKFLEYINKSPKEVSEGDIKEYLAFKLTGDLVTNGSISVIKNALKFYYSDILGKNLSLMKTPRTTKKLPVVLTKKEVRKLLDKTENMKHRLLIELLYSSGMRLSECINLKYNDLDLDECIGWVRKGKGGKDRIFIISDTFKKDLLDYIEKKGCGEYIFNVNGKKMSTRGVQHAIKMSAMRAGIEKNIHVHTIRHTFATHLLENGVDIRKIQVLLGHSSLQTTQIYTQVSSEEIKKIKNPLDML